MASSQGLSILLIYVSIVALNALNIFFDVTFEASIPNLVEREHVGVLQSYSHSTRNMTDIIGPVLGGVVYSMVDPETFMLFNGLSFLLSAASEMLISFGFNRDLDAGKELVPSQHWRNLSGFKRRIRVFLEKERDSQFIQACDDL